MASGGNGAVLRQVNRLFGRGTVAGLGEGQLLERYLAGRDEVAFEALVARHGPMVLGVCRRLLRDPDDVEDAFQATFLVLVKKAGAIRDRELLGPWLYGVAHRVAVRSRGQQTVRRSRELTGTVPEPAEGPDEPGSDELRPVLDEEIGRLPDKYRTPILLCYFEGRTHDEAAAQLRWPVGTVRSRLARGRDLLRGRLTRRGLAPSAGLLAAGLPIRETSAAVSPALLDATVRAATRFAAGRAMTAGAVSASVATLTQGVLTTMFLTKLKVAAVGVLFAGIAASSAGLWAVRGSIAADGPKDGAAQSTDDAPNPIKGDLAKLQGTWVVSSTIPRTGVIGDEETWEIQGRSLKTSYWKPDRDGKSGRVSFIRYQIKLDEVWTPNQITMIPMDRSHVRLGIYRLLGDRFEVCLSAAGEPAPQFFDAKEDRTFPILMVFQREGGGVTDREKTPKPESSDGRKTAPLNLVGDAAPPPPVVKEPSGKAPTDGPPERPAAPIAGGGEGRAFAEARMATARDLFDEEWKRLTNSVGSPIEAIGPSQLWMESELSLSDKQADRVAAIQAHLDRMKKIEDLTNGYARAGQGRVADALRAKYYRLEAEQMLAKAGGGKSSVPELPKGDVKADPVRQPPAAAEPPPPPPPVPIPSPPSLRATTERKADLKPEVPLRSDGGSSSIRELGVRLRSAQDKFEVSKGLVKTGAVPRGEFAQNRDDVEILKAQLDAKRDALLDAKELIEAQLEAKRAEIAGAEAQMELEALKLESIERMGARKVVSTGEIKLAAFAVKTKEADRDVKRAELKEIEVRLKQIDRQLALIGQIKPDEKDSAPAAPSSTERPPPPPR